MSYIIGELSIAQINELSWRLSKVKKNQNKTRRLVLATEEYGEREIDRSIHVDVF